MQSLSNQPASVAPGAVFTLRVTTVNGGTRRARRSTARAYLSRDSRRGNGDPRLVPAASVPLLKPGKSVRRAVKVTVPGSTAAGRWYLIVCADDTRRVRERNDRNNCRTSQRRMSVVRPVSPRCSKTAAAGSDLSRFLATIGAGEVGCLRGGKYTDGAEVTWSVDASASNRAVVKSYPGEEAEIVGTEVQVAGDFLTLMDITVRDIRHADADGIAASGTGFRLEHNKIERVSRSGILLHTSSRDGVITRNFVNVNGTDGHGHGIYVQGVGHSVTRNLFVKAQGYAIQLYMGSTGPSNIVVAQNTGIGSVAKAGILVECNKNCRVVNNIFASNATAGITYRSCSSGCAVDTNITWGNGVSKEDSLASRATNTRNVNPKFIDAHYRVARTSPAVGAARSDFAYFPDLDGKGLAALAPDLGAYER